LSRFRSVSTKGNIVMPAEFRQMDRQTAAGALSGSPVETAGLVSRATALNEGAVNLP
jgi:hypothetical protein